MFIPKHMIVAHMIERPQIVAPIEATSLESASDKVAALHYKKSVRKDTQMLRYKAAEQNGNEKLKHNSKDKV